MNDLPGQRKTTVMFFLCPGSFFHVFIDNAGFRTIMVSWKGL